MRKRLLLIGSLIAMATLLSGCFEINEPISSESEGIWNSFFVYPLSFLITYIAEGVFNEAFGASIVIVTVLLRILILPLNVKQLKSSQAMQLIQPELKEIREKYSSKDAQTQQKLQQETMALFQRHGVNPLAGCLPIIAQMPILIAFYHAIVRTDEIAEHSFLWFELGEPSIILAFITFATTFIQQKIMMAGTPAADNPQMQIMLYLLPVMIGAFALFFPAALALYWVVGNFFMIAQTLLIRRPMMREFEKNNGGSNK
ncbi:YidC family membrane integrase SpoIIIJ [Alkalibacillus haloalkaliphilus]|uniref:YidC family membrane integrase SpoIIIJ n=1 Tax=Alkalibacillus haloalkaliphilus TaxID=94136 RepID=UPI002935FFDB|nr:YidC family membrane integrase SpoIIIJ [Alkalibacillus haloalkaliphilus]MDV2581607.1 YidC family membrane integrase SpoIIIJ [Alkalibacillus haloalkaliphilus]